MSCRLKAVRGFALPALEAGLAACCPFAQGNGGFAFFSEDLVCIGPLHIGEFFGAYRGAVAFQQEGGGSGLLTSVIARFKGGGIHRAARLPGVVTQSPCFA